MERTVFLDHYRICTNQDGSPETVSRAGATTSYKAIDTRSNAAVQLQLVPLAIVDAAKREQFKERAETAQKLDHVNIAKILTVGIEQDHLVLISENLEGETADRWIVAHGTMSADSVLRIALQVVRAIKAAAFFNLTHRAIQPSNLKIVPGESPDGGWPFVKILNFGIAGLELHSASAEGSELAPLIAPQFASPEQLLNREIDFRSEMYSLGATMCFLLTGATPLAVRGMTASLRLQRLPELRRAPKVLHNVLVHLLRENPENRPRDPVAFEHELRDCLTKIERRQALGHTLGIPLAAVVARKPKAPREPTTPLMQVLRGVAVFAVFLLVGAAAAAYFFPNKIPFAHHSDKIGVPVGVANADTYATAPPQPPAVTPTAATTPPVQANQPPTASTPPTSASVAHANQSPQIAAVSRSQQFPSVTAPNGESSVGKNFEQSDEAQQAQSRSHDRSLQSNSPPVASADSGREPESPAAGPNRESSIGQSSEQTDDGRSSSRGKSTSIAGAVHKKSSRIASADSKSESEAPAAGPDEESASGEDSEQTDPAESPQSTSRSKARTTPNISKRSSGHAQPTRRFAAQEPSERRPIRHNWVHARLLGYTADGRMILRLPSGRTVMARPRYRDDALVPPPRRRVYIERPPIFVPPSQPFYPPDYPFDD